MNTERLLQTTSILACVAVVVLTGMGILMTQAASNPAQLGVTPWHTAPVVKQILAAVIGLAVMFVMSRVTYDQLRQAALPFLLVCGVMLVLVFVPGVRAPIGTFYRRIGYASWTVQPSEFAKLALVLFLASHLCVRRRDPTARKTLGGALFAILAVALLVEREPDLGTAIVIVLTGFTVLYVAGAKTRHLAAVLATLMVIGLASVVLGDRIGAGHRTSRFAGWWDPEGHARDAGYQVLQSLISISASGLRGTGLGAGELRFYIPASNTDYVMAAVAEEMGIMGILVVAICIAVIVLHAHLIVVHNRDPFVRYTAAGIGAMIMWQAIINVAVVTNCIPCTGVTMPFISFGTSSLVAMSAAVGILLRPIPLEALFGRTVARASS